MHRPFERQTVEGAHSSITTRTHTVLSHTHTHTHTDKHPHTHTCTKLYAAVYTAISPPRGPVAATHLFAQVPPRAPLVLPGGGGGKQPPPLTAYTNTRLLSVGGGTSSSRWFFLLFIGCGRATVSFVQPCRTVVA